MLVIAGGILTALLLLVVVVLCLYFKIGNALKSSQQHIQEPWAQLNAALSHHFCILRACSDQLGDFACEFTHPYFCNVSLQKRNLGQGAAKESGHNPDTVLYTKNSQAETIATESYPALQCREGCRMYADFDSLPPCCCDINEGL
ncbi:protein FAM24B isoform X2 [Callithrix jacchus]